MLKVWGTASGYLPIGTGSVVALSLRGGRVVPLDDRSRTIIPRRFFLGGATTMRGFAEEEMLPQDVRAAIVSGELPVSEGGERPVSEGGEAFLLAKAELRTRLRGRLEGALFADLGNVWLDPRKYRILDLRANVGVGLRFVTPIGPAAVDLGVNLEPDDAIDERSAALHFTIGLF
jgi:outer membrane protein assembly factor BamA